jgi:hypothetical protein
VINIVGKFFPRATKLTFKRLNLKVALKSYESSKFSTKLTIELTIQQFTKLPIELTIELHLFYDFKG